MSGDLYELRWLSAPTEPLLQGVSREFVPDVAPEPERIRDRPLRGVDADDYVRAGDRDFVTADREGGLVELVPGDGPAAGRCAGSTSDRDVQPERDRVGELVVREGRGEADGGIRPPGGRLDPVLISGRGIRR